MTYPVGPLSGVVRSDGELSGRLSGGGGLSGGLSLDVATAPAYDGPYEFTPTNEAQVVEIRGKQATSDITINPIPSNYGLITWNGSTLTVS